MLRSGLLIVACTFSLASLVAALPFVCTPAPSQMELFAENIQKYVGNWHGVAGSKAIQLTIKPDGSFQWMATAGQARGEGDGQIRIDEARCLIELPIIDTQPLQLELTEAGKSLVLSKQNGANVVLSRQ